MFPNTEIGRMEQLGIDSHTIFRNMGSTKMSKQVSGANLRSITKHTIGSKH